MKRLILGILLASSLTCWGAITEYYVKEAATGDGLGGSEANAMSYTDFLDYMATGGTYNATAGARFNIKQDTYTSRTTNTDTWVNGGTPTSPVVVRGYKTAITDGYQGRTSVGALDTANCATFTYTTGQINITGTNILVESLIVNHASNGNGFQVSGQYCVIRGCKFTNAATGTSARSLYLGVAYANAVDCDVVMTNGGGAGASAVIITSGSASLVGCRVTGTAVGVQINSENVPVFGNTIYGCGTDGVFVSNAAYSVNLINNTIVGNTSSGVQLSASQTKRSTIMGNMITDNGAYGVDCVDAAGGVFFSHNRYRDNTPGNVNSGTDWVTVSGYGNVTTDTGGAETDYVASGSNDYHLIAASPGVNIFLNGLSAGAFQRDQTGGGGGSFTFGN